MARPTLNELEHGVEGWDELLNENFEILTNGPAPLKVYADSAAMDAVPANSYDGCTAVVDDDEIKRTLAVSDGVSRWARCLTETAGSEHGAKSRLLVLEEEVTLGAGPSFPTATPLPLGATLVGVTARVTQVIVGPATFKITRDLDTVASGIAATLGETVEAADAECAYPVFYPTTPPVITIETEGADFVSGKVRIAQHYTIFSAPTS